MLERFYYARAVDVTILLVINEITMVQSDLNENTNNTITMLLHYLTTYPNTKIRYHTSDIELYIESDATLKARSRIAEYFLFK